MDTVKITGLSHDGRGIAHRDGKTIFVENALVGEEVAIAYQKRKSRWDEAKAVTINQPSSDRIAPPCASFDICGGCSLQHLAETAQIEHKQAVLLEQLTHIGGVKPKEILAPIRGQTLGYRGKARLGVRYVIKKQKLLIGFREKNGRYLADIETCEVLHPSIGEKIPLLRNFLMTLDGFQQIPQLEIAVGEEATAIIIRHLAPLSTADLARIATFGEVENYHLYLQPKGAESVHRFYPSSGLDRLHYTLPDYNIEMQFHPTDFTQVNASVNQQLVSLAISLLQPQSHESFLDLFCGIGNFTLPLARHSHHVLGIEGSETMVSRAYENATHNQIENVTFQSANLAENIEWCRNPVDGVLIDPPRVGALEVVQALATSNASRIVYVSCNPATLARDAQYLCQHGFYLAKVGVLDMFPHTTHVESIALFTRV